MIDFNQERPMTPDAAAKFCQVSRRTIENWFKAGLEAVTLGGKVYTSRGALTRFARPRGAMPPPLEPSPTDEQMRVEFGL